MPPWGNLGRQVKEPHQLVRLRVFSFLLLLQHLDRRLTHCRKFVSDYCEYARWGQYAEMHNALRVIRMLSVWSQCRSSVSNRTYIFCNTICAVIAQQRITYPQLTRCQITHRKLDAFPDFLAPPSKRCNLASKLGTLTSVYDYPQLWLGTACHLTCDYPHRASASKARGAVVAGGMAVIECRCVGGPQGLFAMVDASAFRKLRLVQYPIT